jgi:MSHA biogenesis protein MshP
MSLVAAVFLIVVVAALGAFAIRVGSGQQQTVNLALLSGRALAAANSGIEWGTYEALTNDNCGNTTLNLTQAALSGFTVVVTCTSTVYTEGTSYLITAFASSGTYGMPEYVSRREMARLFK